MVSTYHGIETGRRAITYQRKGMEIAGINTSKAQDAGYSRQVVNKAASAALITNPASISRLGTGVEITSIERMRDHFLDARMRRATVEQTYWSTMETGMARVDTFIVNTNDVGLNNVLDNFWAALQEVHKNPSEQEILEVFLEEANMLTDFAQTLSSSYNAYRDELNDDIRAMVEDTNLLIDQIALLNKGIRTIRAAGGEPNELLDKRDLLVDKLCMLTGATASSDIDEKDGDYKITLNGKLLVQGENVRHLILVENPGNKGYYEVQIEYNQYDITSDPSVAEVLIERRADDLRPVGSCTTDGTHELEVVRTADEAYWTVGYGRGQSAVPNPGNRMDGITNPETGLGIDGSFALQVGSGGVRAYSEAFTASPPGIGVVLGEPGPNDPQSYTFRIAAGDFESTVEMTWNGTGWTVQDNLNPPNTFTTTGTDLTAQDLARFIDSNYASEGIVATASGNALVIESADRQLLSITDIDGGLMSSCGLSNDNPIVLIEVTSEDSLQTIANKINNAYMFDRMEQVVEIDEETGEAVTEKHLSYTTVPPKTAPSSPEQWLHASVEIDANGEYYLCLTSNVAGEASRINVMPGTVCGGDVSTMNVAGLLGLVETDAATGQTDVTSYIQLDRENETIVTRYTEGGDVFVDDAYIKMDGEEYLSAVNDFKDARRVSKVGEARADTLTEFSPGIRASLQGVGTTTITVRHPLTEGTIFATIKLRDDVLLSQMDLFDDMMYKLATEFNAIHYAGYGAMGSKNENVTGMAFFEQITGSYGAFGKLAVDDLIDKDPSRIAAASGNGSGNTLGKSDGTNALSMAQLKQAKLFMSGIADFGDLYKHFVAEMGSFGSRAQTMLKDTNYIVEQIGIERSKIMGVNSDEEMLNLVELNQQFNSSSQYISTLFQVIDQIISGVGRVGI